MGKMHAHFRREERYEGLLIVFYGDEERARVESVLAAAKEKYGVNPEIVENSFPKEPEKSGIYIEFNDDYDREAGDFFEMLIKELDIKCDA